MTLLEEFIFSLNRTERGKLRPLQFRGVKRKVFRKIITTTDSEGIPPDQFISQLKITQKRFYQIYAEMLHSCYHDVAPAGGTELLQYLGNMQLYRHFYIEMKRQEKELIDAKDSKALEDFYFKVLLMSEFFLIPPNKAGKIRPELLKYVTRYTKVKQPHPCDQRFIRCTEIEQEMYQNFMRNFSLEKLKRSVDELEEIYRCVRGKDHALAKFKVTYILAMIYFWNFFPEKKPEPYLEFLKQIINDHRQTFGSVGELMRMGVESYTRPNPADISLYKKFLDHPTPTGEGSSLLFIERFLPMIVIEGEIAWAKKFIADRFPLNPGQLHKDIAMHWWRLLVIYYIHSNDFLKAMETLEKAIASNTGKTRNVTLDINLRCYKIFLFVMLNGPGTASEEIGKHIRYARRHGFNKGEGFMMLYLKAVSDLVGLSPFEKEQAQKIRARYVCELASETRLFPLFDKIYQKYYT